MSFNEILYYLMLLRIVVNASGFGQPYISSWTTIHAQTNGPYTVAHTLGEYPAKVDVQIKISHSGSTYIFSGMGSAQRDDDSDTYYGAIVYTYNQNSVRLYVPKDTGSYGHTDKGGLVYTGGSAFTGPYNIYSTTAEVRVRAWKQCQFPPPAFTSAGAHRIFRSGGSSFVEVAHGLGVTPDYVVVQLKMSDGYISEAEGALYKGATSGSSYDTICGTTFAYNKHSIRIWSARNGVGSGYVFCAYDGWGSPATASNADLYIQTWVFDKSVVKVSKTQEMGRYVPLINSNVVNFGGTFDYEEHMFLVQVTALDGNNAGYVFHGAGTSMTDSSLGSYGGVVYGYTDQDVMIWRPADGKSTGYMVYVGGDWGGGSYPQSSLTANVTVKVIQSKSNEGACGQGICSSDWSLLSITCDCSNTDKIGTYCHIAQVCPIPASIPNSDALYEGINNGNRALYSCHSGFHSNSGDNMINCTGTSWSSTTFSCTANSALSSGSSSCPDPPDILNADKLVADNTTLYSCQSGYTPNAGSSQITCSNSLWSSTSFQCVSIAIPTSGCSDPPDITNAEKLVASNITLYSCENGYISTSGSRFITCSGSVWSSTSYHCDLQTSTPSCPDPPDISNADKLVSSNTTLYSCRIGYASNSGSNLITCSSSVWTLTSFQCNSIASSAVCPDPPDIPNADKHVSSNTTMYSCHVGYTPNSDSNLITCSSTTWSLTSFRCDSIASNSSCPDPPDIANADKHVSINTTMYSCHMGYTPTSGSNLVTCSFSAWTLTSYQCEIVPVPISCPDPPDILNADKFVSTNTTMYSCHNGYTPNSGNNTITCSASTWTSTSFQCSATPTCTSTAITVYNLTLQQRIDKVKKALTIEIKNTSVYRRSLICASDPRPSAAHVGYVGIILLSGTMGLLVFFDLTTLFKSNNEDEDFSD